MSVPRGSCGRGGWRGGGGDYDRRQLIKVPRSFAKARGIRDDARDRAPIPARIVSDRSRIAHDSRGGEEGIFTFSNRRDSRDADIPRLTFRACPAGSILS